MIISMLGENEVKADFCLEIQFDKDSENPNRVFKAISAIIDTFEGIDRNLAITIDSKIESVLILEDIEGGSIKVWLANKIKRIFDDESLKSGDIKKVIGDFLVKAKWIIINKLEGKTKITDKAEIQEIQDEIFQLAKSTDVRHFPAYIPLDKTKLLNGIENITQALSYLTSKDRAYYIADEKKASFNLDFKFIPEEIEELITKESSSSESTMIIKVKKPDYLGFSMWEFHHGTSPLSAKILDEKWLDDFHKRKMDVRPGDSLKVRIRITNNYDYDHNLISVKYQILKVLDILHPPSSDQYFIDEELN